MTRKTVGIASVLVTASMIAAALIAGSMLPETMRLPVHWDLGGEADSFAGKWTALLAPAGILAGVSLLFYFLPGLEPRREGLQRSQGLYLWGWIAILLLGAVIQFIVLSEAFGWGVPTNHLMIGALGVVLVLIGNQLGKSRSMFLIGIRTPWTLSSEEVWIKTHRLCGKLMVASGLLMLLAAWLPLPSGLLATVAIAAISITAGVPILYSFILWRRERADRAAG